MAARLAANASHGQRSAHLGRRPAGPGRRRAWAGGRDDALHGAGAYRGVAAAHRRRRRGFTARGLAAAAGRRRPARPAAGRASRPRRRPCRHVGEHHVAHRHRRVEREFVQRAGDVGDARPWAPIARSSPAAAASARPRSATVVVTKRRGSVCSWTRELLAASCTSGRAPRRPRRRRRRPRGGSRAGSRCTGSGRSLDRPRASLGAHAVAPFVGALLARSADRCASEPPWNASRKRGRTLSVTISAGTT